MFSRREKKITQHAKELKIIIIYVSFLLFIILYMYI